MYLLKRLIQPPRGDHTNGDSGAELGSSNKPNMGFSLEQGRRPYMEVPPRSRWTAKSAMLPSLLTRLWNHLFA
jgi:hypothetical protein